MTDLPLNPKRKLFRWGPIPCRVNYIAIFLETLIEHYHEHFDYSWPGGVVLFKERNMCWVLDNENFFNSCEDIFRKYMLDDEKRKAIYQEYIDAIDQIVKLRKKIDNIDITAMDDFELKDLYEDFIQKSNMVAITSLQSELGNYGAIGMLRERLKEHIPESELDSVMEILTAPEEMSFFQIEEVDLVETEDIEEHAKKYVWLKNGYGAVHVLDKGFFAKRKKELPDDLKRSIEAGFKEAKQRKVDVKEKYDLPEDIMHFADVMVDCIVWQDARKAHLHIDLHYKDMFLKEVSRRKGYDIEILRDALLREVSDIISGVDLKEALQARTGYYAIDCSKGLEFITGNKAKDMWDAFMHEDVKEDIKEFKGVPASKGKAIGKVKILMDPYATDSFDQDDILVCPMTSPEYIFAMKKAAAVVTDTGGLTSHAAIVSRELKIPCIIGTRIATKALKDGQRIEVDADNGIVRIKDD